MNLNRYRLCKLIYEIMIFAFSYEYMKDVRSSPLAVICITNLQWDQLPVGLIAQQLKNLVSGSFSPMTLESQRFLTTFALGQ